VARIEQEILAIDVVNVAIVGICPFWWPGINQDKCVASVFKAWPSIDDLGPTHFEAMLSSEPGAKAVLGNALSAAGITSSILLPASLWSTRLLAAFIRPCFLTARFLTAFIRSSRFWSPSLLPILFLLALPHFAARLRFPLSSFLLIGSCRPGLVLPRTIQFILSGLWPGLILSPRFVTPRLFLSRFVFLLFFVLRIKNRRTRDQSRENA
jgi:hypothetical protein